MSASRPNLFTRNDTFFGVCEAIGGDCGFDPIYLRIALGALVLWNPAAAIGAYLAAGVLVLLSRWLLPSRPLCVAQPDDRSAAPAAPLAADNDEIAVAIAA